MSHRPFETLHRTDVLRDPYPYYAALRRAAPVYSDEAGRWFVTRYDDALSLLTGDAVSADRLRRGTRPRLGADDPTVAPLFDALTWQILFLDPPHHTRLRALVAKAFTPSLVHGLRAVIQRRVDALLDRALGKGWLDVIDELALPLPLGVICDMLDVPAEDRGKLRKWSNDYAAFLGSGAVMSIERLRECSRSLCDYMAYFHELSEQRQGRLGDDLLSRLLLAEADDAGVGREIVSATAVMLITAGHETTTNLIGNGLLALLRHPELIAQLRAAPELWPAAIEELLRYDSPVQFVVRRLARDVSLDGEQLAQDDFVYILTGSANRDPGRFAEPDRIDFNRGDNRHLSFGQGPHYCIGAALSRLEAQIALSTLLRRSQCLRVLDVEPEWVPNPALRGMVRFRVQVEPG